MTGGFRSQMVSNAENVSIWWRHHVNKHIKTDIYTIANNDRILLVWTTGCGWRHTMTDEKTLRKFHGFLWLQWEFQIGPCEGIDIGDHLWMARFILARVAEDFRAGISFECRPVAGDYVGPTANVNVSTIKTRKEGGMRWVQWKWRTVTCTFLCVCVWVFASPIWLLAAQGAGRTQAHKQMVASDCGVTTWCSADSKFAPSQWETALRGGGGGGGGGLGWVLDGDAQHCPLTRNATKGAKKGCRNYTFRQVLTKNMGRNTTFFFHFCSNIGVETIQIFQRPEKGGRNGGAYVVTFFKWVPSPEALLCNDVSHWLAVARLESALWWHHYDYYFGTLFLSQAITTHLKIEYP